MVGRDNLLHQGQAGATALSLGGGAALKEPAPQVGRDSGTGVLNTEQKPASSSRILTVICLVPRRDWLSPSMAFSIRFPSTVTLGIGREPGTLLPQNTVLIQCQTDSQFIGAAGLAHQQCSNRGLMNLIHDTGDSFLMGTGGIHDILLCLVRRADLQESQNDMEFIHKLVGIGSAWPPPYAVPRSDRWQGW